MKTNLNLCYAPQIDTEMDDETKNRFDVKSILNTSFEQLNLDEAHHSPACKRRSLDKVILTRAKQDTELFKPTCSDRLIGRFMGVKSLDIPARLSLMNISCVSDILDHLDDHDICKYVCNPDNIIVNYIVIDTKCGQ